jgi:hypothetical protein
MERSCSTHLRKKLERYRNARFQYDSKNPHYDILHWRRRQLFPETFKPIYQTSQSHAFSSSQGFLTCWGCTMSTEIQCSLSCSQKPCRIQQCPKLHLRRTVTKYQLPQLKHPSVSSGSALPCRRRTNWIVNTAFTSYLQMSINL